VREAQLLDSIASAVAAPSTTAPPAARPATDAAQRTGHGRVLVAEDNSVNQKVAAAMLKHLGYQVDVVANGREAVEATDRVSYAAVLMDCQMPEMNGYEASMEIRRREESGPRVPIVAVTASAIKGDEERCLAAGMDTYVTKPVTVEALGRVLAGLIPPERVEVEIDDAVLDRATLDTLWELGADSPAVLEELAASFIQGAPADLAALNGAVATVDLDAAAHAAHRLKGSCAAVGATRMGRLAAQIEAAAIDHHAEGMADQVAEIEASFEDVRGALRAAAGASAGRR
jgi:CheY-like chemotaxis protein